MNRISFILAVLLLAVFLITPGCGKKGDPSLPKQNLSLIILH
jgi:predicted small lipoprotein YifL